MKFLVILWVIVCLAAGTAIAQTNQWAWAKAAYCTDYANGESIARDSHHNNYVTGTFSDSITIGDTTFVTSNMESTFIAKYDPDGRFLWARHLESVGDTFPSNYWSRIAVLNDTSFVVTGMFLEKLEIGNSVLTSKGGWDAFIALYNVDGELLKLYQIGGPRDELDCVVKPDAEGNFYALINHEWSNTPVSVVFGHDTTFSLPYCSQFLAKFSPDLKLTWVRKYNSMGGFSLGGSIESDESGDITVLLPYVTQPVFTDVDTLTPHSVDPVFFLTFDPQGTQKADHEVPNHSLHWFTIDSNHDFYTLGDMAPHDTLVLGTDTLTTFNYSDLVMACYDSNFNVKWYRQFQREYTYYGIGMISLIGDEVVIGASYSGFMNICGHNFPSWNNGQCVIGFFDKGGNCIDAISTIGSNATVNGVGLLVDDCDVVLFGGMSGDPWFGPDTLNGNSGTVLAKLHRGGAVLDFGPDTTVCGSLRLSGLPGGLEYSWSDGSSEQDFTVHQTGKYELRMITGNNCYLHDSINVIVKPVPVVDIGNDTTITVRQVLLLTAPPGYDSYLWNTGNTQNTLIVIGKNYPPGTHVFSVRVRLGDCYTNDSIRVTIPDTLGIANNLQGSMTVHPNPAHDQVIVSLNGIPPGTFSVDLTTIQGEVVIHTFVTGNNLKFSFPVSLREVNPGMYFLRIGGTDRQIVGKLVIN